MDYKKKYLKYKLKYLNAKKILGGETAKTPLSEAEKELNEIIAFSKDNPNEEFAVKLAQYKNFIKRLVELEEELGEEKYKKYQEKQENFLMRLVKGEEEIIELSMDNPNEEFAVKVAKYKNFIKRLVELKEELGEEKYKKYQENFLMRLVKEEVGPVTECLDAIVEKKKAEEKKKENVEALANYRKCQAEIEEWKERNPTRRYTGRGCTLPRN